MVLVQALRGKCILFGQKYRRFCTGTFSCLLILPSLALSLPAGAGDWQPTPIRAGRSASFKPARAGCPLQFHEGPPFYLAGHPGGSQCHRQQIYVPPVPSSIEFLILRYRDAILYLPENLYLLSRLTFLDVSGTYCNLGDIFHSRDVFPCLTDLSFSWPEEGGEPVPDVVFRPSLRKLTISRVRGALPQGLGHATALTTLILVGALRDGQGALKQLPDSLGDMCELEVLEVTGTGLEGLPLTFTKLIRLKQVRLAGNRLSTLPPLVNLVLLEYLDVSDNALGFIPSLSGLKNLGYVNLSNNKLATPPKGLPSLPTLQEVTLDAACLAGLSWWERQQYEYARLPINKIGPDPPRAVPRPLSWAKPVAISILGVIHLLTLAYILWIIDFPRCLLFLGNFIADIEIFDWILPVCVLVSRTRSPGSHSFSHDASYTWMFGSHLIR